MVCPLCIPHTLLVTVMFQDTIFPIYYSICSTPYAKSAHEEYWHFCCSYQVLYHYLIFLLVHSDEPIRWVPEATLLGQTAGHAWLGYCTPQHWHSRCLMWCWQLRVPSNATGPLLPPWWMAPHTMTERHQLPSVGRMHVSISPHQPHPPTPPPSPTPIPTQPHPQPNPTP